MLVTYLPHWYVGQQAPAGVYSRKTELIPCGQVGGLAHGTSCATVS